ncbi:hypothetical protein AAG906_021313 [Vitis piasezkii]
MYEAMLVVIAAAVEKSSRWAFGCWGGNENHYTEITFRSHQYFFEGLQSASREVDKTPSEHASLVGLNDAADEFFDVPEPSDSDLVENG